MMKNWWDIVNRENLSGETCSRDLANYYLDISLEISFLIIIEGPFKFTITHLISSFERILPIFSRSRQLDLLLVSSYGFLMV